MIAVIQLENKFYQTLTPPSLPTPPPPPNLKSNSKKAEASKNLPNVTMISKNV